MLGALAAAMLAAAPAADAAVPSEARPQFSLPARGSAPACIFATTAAQVPVIWVWGPAGWSAVAFDDEAGREWVFAGAEPDGTLWGVLESAVEGPAWELVVLRSTDGGKRWRASQARKPTYLAQFVRLSVAPSREAALTVRVGDDAAGRPTAGEYTATLLARGTRWSPFRRTDGLTPATSVDAQGALPALMKQLAPPQAQAR